jgi:hypothetical protein
VLMSSFLFTASLIHSLRVIVEDPVKRTGVMVFSATFNNISVLSWRSVLLVEETGVPGVNHPPVASYWQIYHIMAVNFWIRFQTSTILVRVKPISLM